MKKLTIDCIVGDEVYFNWDKKYAEATIREINEIWFVLDVQPEFVDLPIIGAEIGFSKLIIREGRLD
jgi:hypothetical protein